MPPPRPNTGEGGASSAPPLSCKPPRATSPTATQRCSPSAPLRWAATEVASYHTIARRTSAWFFSGDDDVAVPSDAALLRSLLYRSSPHMPAGAGLPWSSVHTWPLRYPSPGSRSWVSLRASLFPFTIDAAGVRYLVVVKKPSVVDPTPHVCPAGTQGTAVHGLVYKDDKHGTHRQKRRELPLLCSHCLHRPMCFFFHSGIGSNLPKHWTNLRVGPIISKMMSFRLPHRNCGGGDVRPRLQPALLVGMSCLLRVRLLAV